MPTATAPPEVRKAWINPCRPDTDRGHPDEDYACSICVVCEDRHAGCPQELRDLPRPHEVDKYRPHEVDNYRPRG